MTLRRIVFFTGTRADYGLLHWPMRAVREHPGLELRTIVSGTHLSPEFGMTVDEIEADGIPVDERVEMLISGDTAVAATKSLGLATIGYGEALDRLRPDVLVLLGDRYEVLAAAQAALLARVPIAHLHGGETTAGAIDESIRHAVTKMSHLHFVAAEPFARRVRQLGEAAEHVHVVGAPGLDAVRHTTLMHRDALGEALGAPLGPRVIAVTYHPVTLEHEGPDGAMAALFAALDQFPETQVIFTMPNADVAGRRIRQLITERVERDPSRLRAFSSLGRLRYLSLMREAAAVVGNSSSGLIEAPALHTPTVNLGRRQEGRLRGPTVLDCGERAEEIAEGIERALSPECQTLAARESSPYGDGHASERIVRVLAETDLDNILVKRFHARP